MQRRTFLRFLGLGAASVTAAAVVPDLLTPLLPDPDPERRLWIPGARSFFDLGAGRPADDWFEARMAFRPEELADLIRPHLPFPGNRLLTVDIVTREALAVLQRQLAATHRINREYGPIATDEVTGIRLHAVHGYHAQAVHDLEHTINHAVRGLADRIDADGVRLLETGHGPYASPLTPIRYRVLTPEYAGRVSSEDNDAPADAAGWPLDGE